MIVTMVCIRSTVNRVTPLLNYQQAQEAEGKSVAGTEIKVTYLQVLTKVKHYPDDPFAKSFAKTKGNWC